MIRTLIATALVLMAQNAPTPSFRTGIEVVRVNALVTDGGRPITDLTARNFELTDNGVPQQIQAASVADAPVSMSLVLDTSDSVKGPTLARLKSAAAAAVDELTDRDAISLVTFNSSIQRRLSWSVASPRVRATIESVEASGRTSLYDAMFAALAAGDSASGNRQLLLLFSDGIDTSSWLPPAAVLDRAHRSDAVIYSIVLGATSDTALLFRRSGLELLDPAVPRAAATPFLLDLARSTGGSHHVAESADALARLFRRVITEFRTRYLLTYTPRGVDKDGWHPIEVRLKGAKGKLTARRGYLR